MDALQERVIDLTIELVYLKVENELLREECERLKKLKKPFYKKYKRLLRLWKRNI